jgi:Ser/Thr protein kinase RdoA (MazF antagonist)
MTRDEVRARVDMALRPREMAPRLAAALEQAGRPGSARRVRPGSCRVLDAKVEPGVQAMMLYALDGLLVRGDLVGVGRPGGPGPEGTWVPDPGVLLFLFPHDPALPHLPSLLARGGAATVLGTRGPARAELLRYRPGKRATLRLAAPGRDAVVAKVYHDPAKAATVALEARALQSAVLAERPAVLRLAPPARAASGLAGTAVVLQREVRGTPLDALLAGSARAFAGAGPGARAVAGVHLAAAALAELHRLPALSGRARPVARELDRFVLRADRVATLDPGLGRDLRELAARLADLDRRMPPGRTGLVHGDCKPGQFLLRDRTAVLLDLDHCGSGEQAGDVGTFLATLRQHGLAELGAEFLDGYREHRSGETELARIRWHEAVALERKALRAFARAPRSPVPAALVQQGHLCLDVVQEAA